MECTLCNTALKEKADDYYFVCSTCGAYVKDRQFYVSAEYEKNRYEEHNNDVNDSGYQKFTSPVIQTVLENFNTAHLGLDYGCGTGPVISKVLNDNGYHVKLYDPYFYPDDDYINHTYDYIFGCEVFEHFYQPKQEIEKLLELLKPNGKLIIMTHLYDRSKNFKNWYYRNDPTHVFIYTKKTVHYLKKIYKLKIEKQDERLIVLKKLPKKLHNPNLA